MVFVTHEIPLIVSSDSQNGALNISKDGDAFTVQLDNAISIPKEAISCTLEVNSATVVWVVPNISAELKNNQITVIEKGITFDFTIPDGLYSMSDLTAFLIRQFAANGLPDDLLTFYADNSTQKIVMTFNYPDTQVDFSVLNAVNNLLGFDPVLTPPSPSTAGQSITGDIRATFNSITNFLISCDLVGNGIPINSKSEQVIASIPITASPGSTINYRPVVPPKANAYGLIGHSRSSLRMRLTDQRGSSVDTFSESWSALIIIKYTLQMNDTNPARSYKSHHGH